MLSEIVPIFFPSPKISSTHKKTHIHTHKTQNSYFLHRKIQYSFFPLFPDLESPPPQACGTGGIEGLSKFRPPKGLKNWKFSEFPLQISLPHGTAKHLLLYKEEPQKCLKNLNLLPEAKFE